MTSCPDAVATVLDEYKTIKDNADFAGVCGYMAHRDGRIIGLPLVEADSSEIELRYRYHVYGDMCEVFRTDVLREFPFPELKGERFCPESLVWNRIARKYKLHVFPKSHLSARLYRWWTDRQHRKNSYAESHCLNDDLRRDARHRDTLESKDESSDQLLSIQGMPVGETCQRSGLQYSGIVSVMVLD